VAGNAAINDLDLNQCDTRISDALGGVGLALAAVGLIAYLSRLTLPNRRWPLHLAFVLLIAIAVIGVIGTIVLGIGLD